MFARYKNLQRRSLRKGRISRSFPKAFAVYRKRPHLRRKTFMSLKSWMTYLLLLFGCMLVVIWIDLLTVAQTDLMHDGYGISARLLLYPGWFMLAALMLFTFAVAVRYFDTLQDYIAKLSYHHLVPFLSSCTLVMSWLLQLRKMKTTLTALRAEGQTQTAYNSFEQVHVYTNSLYFNAYIVLFWLSFAILCGWWVVQKRKN